jgi:hypothetical protein
VVLKVSRALYTICNSSAVYNVYLSWLFKDTVQPYLTSAKDTIQPYLASAKDKAQTSLASAKEVAPTQASIHTSVPAQSDMMLVQDSALLNAQASLISAQIGLISAQSGLLAERALSAEKAQTSTSGLTSGPSVEPTAVAVVIPVSLDQPVVEDSVKETLPEEEGLAARLKNLLVGGKREST